MTDDIKLLDHKETAGNVLDRIPRAFRAMAVKEMIVIANTTFGLKVLRIGITAENAQEMFLMLGEAEIE